MYAGTGIHEPAIHSDHTPASESYANIGLQILCFLLQGGGMIMETTIPKPPSQKAETCKRGRPFTLAFVPSGRPDGLNPVIKQEREWKDLRWTKKNSSTNILKN